MLIRCPACQHNLQDDNEERFGIPPWCPRCGADTKGPTPAQKAAARAASEGWSEKWGDRWGVPAAPRPTPVPAAPAAETPSDGVTLRPRVSLVPPAAEAEAPPAGALTEEEPLPVLRPLPDALPADADPPPDEERDLDVRRPAPPGTLPYFHVRVTSSWNWAPKIHRVYVADRDLLFVHLGVNTLNADDMRVQTAVAFGGGLIPYLIAHFVAMRAQAELRRLQRALEAADEDVLRRFAAEDEKSFILGADDLADVVIEPPGFWKKLFSSGCTALLSTHHARRGPLTMELLSVHDVNVAAGELKRLLGEAMRVKVTWKDL